MDGYGGDSDERNDDRNNERKNDRRDATVCAAEPADKNLPQARQPLRHCALSDHAALGPSDKRRGRRVTGEVSCPAFAATNLVPFSVASVSPYHPAYALLFEQRIHKFPGIEWQQIALLFTHAHKTYGQTQFARDRHYYAAFCGSIELGQDDPRDSSRLREHARLLQSILPGGGIHHQQRFVRRTGDDPLRGTAHFVQLRHEIRLGMQAACRVYDYVIGLARGCGLQSVKQYRGRVAAGLGLNHFRSRSLSPDFQLIDRGGAESVGCAQ